MTNLAQKISEGNRFEGAGVAPGRARTAAGAGQRLPFILRAGTSPDYARRRVKDHLLRFIALHDQLTVTKVDEKWLREIESRDNLFPDVDWTYWK